MSRRWNFGNGHGPRLPGAKPDDLVTSIKLPLSPVELLVLWFPRSRTSQVLADTLIQTLFGIGREWETFLKLYLLKSKTREAAIFCDGVDHARTVGFDAPWDFKKDPVYRSVHRGKQKNLILTAVLTEAYEDFEPSAISLFMLSAVTEELLRDGARIRDPRPLAGRFSEAVEQDLEDLFDGE